MRQADGAGLRSEILAGGSLTIRYRQGGERFRPVGRRHGQELKKLLQEAGVPPWERDRLPLLYADRILVAVVGLGIAADHVAESGEAGWQPVLLSSAAVGTDIIP
jgi:tRNA(Ile)-lysidine synthase